MRFPEKRKLFTITEVARACGVSRSTLLRMEESGFLKPFRVDPDTGYRYYDLSAVSAVGQYQMLQSIGLTRKEIGDVYYERIDSSDFLEMLRERQSALEQFIKEFELRHDHSKNFSVSYVTLPAETCYCARIRGTDLEEISMRAYLIHESCVAAGYRLLGSRPMSAEYDDPSDLVNPSVPEFRCTVLIPVLSDDRNDPNLRFLPQTEAISIVGFGDYGVMYALWRRLFAEIETRGLEPAGPPRLIALIAPYTGTHYKREDYCYECVVPIRERKE